MKLKPSDLGRTEISNNVYPKHTAIVEALGDLDEAAAFLGLVAALKPAEATKILKMLRTTQELIKRPISDLNASGEVLSLERKINKLLKNKQPTSKITKLNQTWLAVAIAVTRRAERSVSRLYLSGHFNKLEQSLAYLNKLSKYMGLLK